MTQIECRRRDAEIAALRREGVLLKVLADRFGLGLARVSKICGRLNAKPWAGQCRRGHPRDADNVLWTTYGPRCRQCHNAAGRRYFQNVLALARAGKPTRESA